MDTNKIKAINDAISCIAMLATTEPTQALDALDVVNTVADDLKYEFGTEVYEHFHIIAAKQFELAKSRAQ